MALPKKPNLGDKLRAAPEPAPDPVRGERRLPDLPNGFRTRAIQMRDNHYRPAKTLLVGQDLTFVALFEVFWQAFWKSPKFRAWALREAGEVHDGRRLGRDVDIELPDWLAEDA